MNSELAATAQCFGLYDEDSIIGFCAVIKYPHPTNKKIYRGHRVVILPDYQGCGLGTRFFDMVAEYYTKQGYDYFYSTSQKGMINYCKNSPKWTCVRVGKSPKAGKNSKLAQSFRTNVVTASFIFNK